MRTRAARGIGGFGLLVVTISGSGFHAAVAQEGSAWQPQAVLTPCAGACAEEGRMQLTLSDAGAGGTLASYSSLMKTIDRVQRNAAGNIVIAGALEDGETVIDIAKPGLRRPLAEFWTNAYGISPSGRYVAFTAAVAAHGSGANYANTMIYIYDAGMTAEPETVGPNPPRSAIAVFPKALVERGYPYLMHIPPQRLLSVATIDIKWLGDARFLFLATGQTTRAPGQLYIPVTISAGPDFDWHSATIAQAGKSFACADPDAGDTTVDRVLRQCGQTR